MARIPLPDANAPMVDAKTQAPHPVWYGLLRRITEAVFGAEGDIAALPATIAVKLAGVALQCFTADGTYTPTAGMKFCLVIGTGGGGGGGGADNSDTQAAAAGAGGAAGGTVIDLFTAAEIGASKAVTIGAGGDAGADTGGNGGNGDPTTLGGLLTAPGGDGGSGALTAADSSEVAGVAGPTATGGIVNIDGGASQGGAARRNTFLSSGAGGSSFWGGGAPGNVHAGGSANPSVAGSAASVPGAGGSGALCEDNMSGSVGGIGAAGIMVIIEFF